MECHFVGIIVKQYLQSNCCYISNSEKRQKRAVHKRRKTIKITNQGTRTLHMKLQRF